MNDDQRAAEETPTHDPMRDELFRLLTEEIRDIIETEKISGWTPWLVLATLLSASWVVVQDLWTGQPRWLAVEIVFVVVTISLNLAGIAWGYLAWVPAGGRSSNPFFFLHHKASPLGMLWHALWRSSTAYACFQLAPTLGRLIFATTGTVYAFEALLSLFGMGAVIARAPIPASGPATIGRPLLVLIMLLLITSVEVAAITLAVQSPALHSAMLVDLRMGALMAFGAYGIGFLARRLSGHGDSRETLSAIRRDVALRRVSVYDGIHRARIALDGMGLSDVVTKDMQTLLGFISTVRGEYNEALRKAAALRANISVPVRGGATVPELDRLALGNLLDVFESHEQRVNQIIERYHRELGQIRFRLEIVSRVYKAAAVERDLLLSEIRSAQEPVDQLQMRFVEEHDALQETWNTWCPTNPRDHNPFGLRQPRVEEPQR